MIDIINVICNVAMAVETAFIAYASVKGIPKTLNTNFKALLTEVLKIESELIYNIDKKCDYLQVQIDEMHKE